jgi:FkbM family methyltransferase
MNRGKIEFNVATVDDLNFIIYNPEELMQTFWVDGILYEHDVLNFIKDNYKGGTFVDAGSCMGNHTLFFATLAENVFSFEPSLGPFIHQMLNLSINSNYANIIPYNVGLGNENGIKKLSMDTLSAGGGTIKEDGTELVVIAKLDDFDIKDVKLIKIDVEGYEVEVLKGAEQTIRTYKPDLFIECNTEEHKKNIFDYLKSLDLDYNIYPREFNNTPMFLFTTKSFTSYIDNNNIV